MTEERNMRTLSERFRQERNKTLKDRWHGGWDRKAFNKE